MNNKTQKRSVFGRAPEGRYWRRLLLGALAGCAAILMLGIWLYSGSGRGLTGGPEDGLVQDQTQVHRNTLRSDEVPPQTDGVVYNTDTYDYSVFGSSYRREQIRSVTFLDTLADAPEDAWDVSEAGNGSVMAWVERSGDLFAPYDLYIGGEGGVWTGPSCYLMFAGYTNARQIVFGDAFHTDSATDMRVMFWWCRRLESLDLTGFDTSNVRDMRDMFSCCRKLKALDLSSFDTSNVENMSAMFVGCHALTDLDLSSFNTSRVLSMGAMFSDCKALNDLDLSSFDMTNVQITEDIFLNCPAGADWQHLLK